MGSAREGRWVWQLPTALPRGLASSVSIRDLASSSLRSKSLCFCSLSDSSSVSARRASASSWCRSVICQQGMGILGWSQAPSLHWVSSEHPLCPADVCNLGTAPKPYLLLILLLHGSKVLVPLLVHLQQLWVQCCLQEPTLCPHSPNPAPPMGCVSVSASFSSSPPGAGAPGSSPSSPWPPALLCPLPSPPPPRSAASAHRGTSRLLQAISLSIINLTPQHPEELHQSHWDKLERAKMKPWGYLSAPCPALPEVHALPTPAAAQLPLSSHSPGC